MIEPQPQQVVNEEWRQHTHRKHTTTTQKLTIQRDITLDIPSDTNYHSKGRNFDESQTLKRG